MLWGETVGIHVQNTEQLHAYDGHQNVTEPQATARKVHVYRGAKLGLAAGREDSMDR